MAPVWHFMEDCRKWYPPHGSVPPPPRVTTAFCQHSHWDWVTVAVATCSKSCRVGCDACTLVEEECVGFNLPHAATLPAARLDEFAQLLRTDDAVA